MLKVRITLKRGQEWFLEVGCSKQLVHAQHVPMWHVPTHLLTHTESRSHCCHCCKISIGQINSGLSSSSALSGELPSTTGPVCKLLLNRFFSGAKHCPVCSKFNTLYNFSLGTSTTKGLSFLRYVKA